MNLNNKWLALIPIGLYGLYSFVNVSGYAYYYMMLGICLVCFCAAVFVLGYFVINKLWRPLPIIISAIATVAFGSLVNSSLKDVIYVHNPYEMYLYDCDKSIERKRAGRSSYNIGKLDCKDDNNQPAIFSIETAKIKTLEGKNFYIKYLPHTKSILEITSIE